MEKQKDKTVNRRRFLKISAVAGTGLVFLPALNGFNSVAHAYNTSPGATKFVQTLRGVGPGAIPVAIRDGVRAYNGTLADHYTIDIIQYTDQIHPNLGPTTLWGFNPRNALGGTGIPTPKHLGGIIVAE